MAYIGDVFAGFRECWLIVPEGNGKTTLMAALGLYHLRYQEDASIAIAASSKDQARWLYRQARGFVHRSEYEAAKGIRPFDGYVNVQNKEMNGVMEVFAADERTGDGIIPTLCILDELHRHKSLGLYLTWVGKLRKRPGAQLLTISTAGEPGGEFEEARERIRAEATERDRQGRCFLRATKSDRMLLHEYAVPTDADFTDIELVKEANPLSTITVDTLREDFESPTMETGHWRRFKCNLPTRSMFAAITDEEWAGAAVGAPQIPEGAAVDIGVDLGFKWDTTALVPLWVKGQTRVFQHTRILTPPRDQTALATRLIKEAVAEIHYRNPIQRVVIDPTEARELIEWLEEEIGCDVIEWTNSLPNRAESTKRFMEGLREGWIKHHNEPEFSRQVLNAVARVLPGGDYVFARPVETRNAAQQDRRVIDALVAAAMVNMMAGQKRRKASVFDWSAVDAA
jgi:phage terminase large subunit-like protein